MGYIPVLIFVLILILVAVVVLLKGKTAKEEVFPYIKKNTLLTPAERSFLGVLESAVSEHYRIYAQVRLADIMAVRSGTEKSVRASFQNRINSKHVDFVLCHKDTLEILCAIELDDSSHQRRSRKTRDAFLETACRSAGLPLVRFLAKAYYQVQEVSSSIAAALNTEELVPASPNVAPAASTVSQASDDTPKCPKCGSDMILRTAKSGANSGNSFWGCTNFPACRGVVKVT